MKILIILFGFTILGIVIGVWVFRPTPNSPLLPNITSSTTPEFSIDSPPPQSLTGQIIAFSGAANWQSRSATQASTLTQLQPVLQGESFETGDQGLLSLQFEGLNIKLVSNTKLNIIQTLPVNLVFSQTTGNTEYQASGRYPISIRALRLLINLSEGSYNLTVDPDDSLVNLQVASGSATVAYNDDQNITQVVSIKSRQQLDFDSVNRELNISNYLPK